MKKSIMLATAVGALAIANVAQANIISVGDPLITHSWVQGFYDTGVGSFAQMDVFFISGVVGSGFEAPEFTGLAPGWNLGAYNTPTAAAAFGPALDYMTFDIHFLGNSSDPLTFDFQAYGPNGTVLDAARATWNGNGGWSFVPYTTDYHAELAVPDGGMTSILLGMGMLGLGWVRRMVK